MRLFLYAFVLFPYFELGTRYYSIDESFISYFNNTFGGNPWDFAPSICTAAIFYNIDETTQSQIEAIVAMIMVVAYYN